MYEGIPSYKIRNFNLRLPILEVRRRKFDLILLHKILTGKSGIPPGDIFSVRPSCTRGAALKLVVPKAKFSFRAHFFVNRAGSNYLRFSKNKILPNSLAAFRNMVSRYLDP